MRKMSCSEFISPYCAAPLILSFSAPVESKDPPSTSTWSWKSSVASKRPKRYFYSASRTTVSSHYSASNSTRLWILCSPAQSLFRTKCPNHCQILQNHSKILIRCPHCLATWCNTWFESWVYLDSGAGTDVCRPYRGTRRHLHPGHWTNQAYLVCLFADPWF